MTDRIPEMKWETATWDTGNRAMEVTVTRIEALGRRILWTVYDVGGDEWRIGMGLPQENGLHIVIGAASSQRAAKLDVRDVAHRLGHRW